MVDYQEKVTVVGDHQFITGEITHRGGFVPDEAYQQALDHLVVCCADAAVVHDGKLLLGKRIVEPQPDWWIIGGRMRKGDLFEEAAQRNMKRELGIEFPLDRFSLLGVYSLIWDTRQQEPVNNGCHMVSFTMLLQLTDDEKDKIKLHEEEYGGHQWVDPLQIAQSPATYHPVVVQVANEVLHRLS